MKLCNKNGCMEIVNPPKFKYCDIHSKSRVKSDNKESTMQKRLLNPPTKYEGSIMKSYEDSPTKSDEIKTCEDGEKRILNNPAKQHQNILNIAKQKAVIQPRLPRIISSIETITKSAEQVRIIELISNGFNVVIDSVPGGAKTTTSLLVASANPLKKMLILTYNKSLKHEVRSKIAKLKLKNVVVHTYHSLAKKYFDVIGYDDKIMKTILLKDLEPLSSILYDIIVLDEKQDMTQLYYRFVRKVLQHNNANFQVLILGDKNQGIYGFKGADTRFLTLAHKIWDREFKFETLSTSFRLTNETASFINQVMVGYNRIQTIKSGAPVKYITCNIWSVCNYLIRFIKDKIKNENYKPEDFFILGASLGSGLKEIPMKKLENMLVENDINCYYPSSEQTELSDDVITGKVVFCTFHQSKGRERPIVIIYGFDNSYFTMIAKDMNPYVCPEPIYVATSRAIDALLLIEDFESRPLRFLKKSHSTMKTLPFIEFIELPHGSKMKPWTAFEMKTINCSPTYLTKFLNEDTMDLLDPLMKQLFTTIEEPRYSVNIPNSIDNGLSVENVSDINGVFMPSMYEVRTKEKSTVQEYVDIAIKKRYKESEHLFIKEAYYKLQKMSGLEYHLNLCVIYLSIRDQIYNKIGQISRFDWIDESMIQKCFESIRFFTKEVDYEHEIQIISDEFPEYGKLSIEGFINAVTDEHVIELKCVDSLTTEHLCQLIIYKWMWDNLKIERKQFQIINMKTGEVRYLNDNPEAIHRVMSILLENKYGKKKKCDNETFLKRCASVKPQLDEIDLTVQDDAEPVVRLLKKRNFK